MAQTDLLKKYLDAGLAFTQMTQQRAEAIIKDLVKAGEIQASEATKRRQELVERSRQNTEKMVESIRNEVQQQVRTMGLATQRDITALRKEIAALKKSAPVKATASKAPATKAPAKKAPAKKTAR
jgi:polyhydroxyalkanoate synthesis regulator phasin